MIKNPETYEIMTPESVGVPATEMVLGKHSGRAALQQRLNQLGFELSDEDLVRVFDAFKSLADRKKDIYDGDLIALVEEIVRGRTISTWASSCRSAGHQRHRRRGDTVEAASKSPTPRPVTARSTRSSMSSTASAASRVPCRTACAPCPGRDAMSEVSVRVQFGDAVVGGKGLSTDGVEASCRAYLDAVNRAGLVAERLQAGHDGQTACAGCRLADALGSRLSGALLTQGCEDPSPPAAHAVRIYAVTHSPRAVHRIAGTPAARRSLSMRNTSIRTEVRPSSFLASSSSSPAGWPRRSSKTQVGGEAGLAAGLAGGVLGLIIVIWSSAVYVDGDKRAVVIQKLFGKDWAVPRDRCQRREGSAGAHAAAGLALRLLAVDYDLQIVSVIEVPAEQVGIVTAADGKPLPDGMVFAPDGIRGPCSARPSWPKGTVVRS